MNVAQLKLAQSREVFVRVFEFPRLNERGSIEACVVSSLLIAFPPRFPRLNERGSIEAGSFQLDEHHPIRFPRLNERGSIEALSYCMHCGRVTAAVSTFE